MDDLGALLRAVLEDPAEDTTRLVFADALEERGYELRAALIRQHLESEGDREVFLTSPGLAATYVSHLDPKGLELAPAMPGVSWGVSRGLVCLVHIPTAAFLEHAESIFRAHPVVSVRLTDREPGASVPNGFHWYERWGSENELPSDAPQPIFEHLQGGNLDRRAGMRVYDTRGEALEALSAACVAFGRKAAGLSELVGAT